MIPTNNKHKHLSKEDIALIWLLHENGLKTPMIRQATGRGIQTIRLVIEAGGDETKYRQLIQEFNDKYRPSKKTVTEEPTALDTVNTSIALLKAIEFNLQKQVILLERIYEQARSQNE